MGTPEVMAFLTTFTILVCLLHRPVSALCTPCPAPAYGCCRPESTVIGPCCEASEVCCLPDMSTTTRPTCAPSIEQCPQATHPLSPPLIFPRHSCTRKVFDSN